MGSIPEPHPLDFDWRFDSKTVADLSDIVYKGEPVLAIGCPSLAQHFNRTGREAVLIDRQPFQRNKTQIVRDVNLGGSRVPGFLTAIVDPPWYPEQVSTWIAWAANCVGPSGTVYASIWPNETRPSGEKEYQEALRWMECWSSVVQLDYQPTYEKPLFESIAQKTSQSDDMAKSPRVGRLLEIKVLVAPSLPMAPSSNEKWLRFVINDYQIAVRMRDEEITSPSYHSTLKPFDLSPELTNSAVFLSSSATSIFILRPPTLPLDPFIAVTNAGLTELSHNVMAKSIWHFVAD